MSLCVHGFAFADYEEGLRAYVEQDFKTAIEEWSAPELEQNPEAMFALGVVYMRGEGTTQDQILGAEYYEKSAAMGFSSAQYNLGLAYFNGKGVVQNIERSRRGWGIDQCTSPLVGFSPTTLSPVQHSRTSSPPCSMMMGVDRCRTTLWRNTI